MPRRPDNGLPTEIRWLLGVLATPAGEGAPPPDAAPAPTIDWDLAMTCVREHRVAPFMGPAMRPDVTLPERQRATLGGLRRTSALNSLGLASDLAKSCAALDRAGIEVLAIKGPAFATLVYGSPDRREARDLDLLVRPEALDHALSVLDDLGFRPDGNGPGEVNAHLARVRRGQEHVVDLRHGARSMLIELHVSLVSDDRLFPAAGLQPWENTVTVTVAGVPIRTLSLEAAVVYAAFHGCKHVWARLFWLMDMAAAVQSGAVRWETALTLARRVGCERHLAVALVLARDLLGTPLPPAVASEPALVARAEKAASVMRSTLTAPPLTDRQAVYRIGLARYTLLDIGLHSRWPARWATAARNVRTTESDRRAVPLPTFLSPLYPAVRIGRLLYRRVSGNVE